MLFKGNCKIKVISTWSNKIRSFTAYMETDRFRNVLDMKIDYVKCVVMKKWKMKYIFSVIINIVKH